MSFRRLIKLMFLMWGVFNLNQLKFLNVEQRLYNKPQIPFFG